jgi:predicted nucleic acid-binding protein
MIILDTNVISALMRQDPEPVVVEWLNRQPESSIWTTSITLFEIQFGLQIMAMGKRRSSMLASIELLLETIEGRVASFDRAAAEAASTLSASRHSKGRPVDLRDTMIAGIVISHRATLATRNTPHFTDISARVVNPWAER